MRQLFSWVILLVLIIVGCGSHTQNGAKGSVTAIGAAIGTAAMPGIGTAVGTGVGWVAEKAVNRREAKRRFEAIRDELRKQKALQLKLSAKNLNHSSIMEHLTKEFAREIEYARIAIFENGAGLNFYLNGPFFFPQGKTLSEEGKALFRKIYEKISSTQHMLFVIEASNDNRKNESGQNIWSIVRFWHQKIPLKPHQIIVKTNGKLLDTSRKATTFPAKAYPVRIILIAPST